MTEASFSKRVAFVYLADIQDRFLKKFSIETINSMVSYGLNNSFADTLKSRMVDIISYLLSIIMVFGLELL